MGRGLDHVVHAVRDLDAAAEMYARLGFQVGARNRHPWGTHNRLVQFDGFFIEILTFAEPEKLGHDGFSTLFAAYNRDFAAAHEGLSMLILESRDPEGDAGLYERAGICASPVMRFEREGTRPDGSRVKVGFSLVFAEDPNAPKIHFATCQQHHPENFWNPDFQRHENGAIAIAEAVLVADDPKRHRESVRAFTGAPGSAPSGAGYTYALMRGRLSLTTPAEFSGRYGVASPATSGGARVAALRFEVADMAALEVVLARSGVPYRRADQAIVIAPERAFGATLLFSPAG